MVSRAIDAGAADIRDRVSCEEWETRVDLAALYRAVHFYGWTDLIGNHITARVPGQDGQILINNFGLMYEEVTASSFYKIDLDGNVMLAPPGAMGLNKTGFVIHGAIHAARHDLNVIVHTHSRAGTAVSAMVCGLLPISQQAALLHGRVAYHDYEGPALDMGERERLVTDLDDCEMMVLRNHGLLAGAATIPLAFLNIHRLETACQVQVDAMQLGAPLTMISDEALAATQQAMRAYPERGGRNWNAVKRQIDRIDQSYRY